MGNHYQVQRTTSTTGRFHVSVFEVQQMTTSKPSLSEISQFIQSLPLFAGLSTSALEKLAQASTWKRVKKGAYLFFQLDEAESFFVVRSGSIAIVLDSVDGRELVINEMRAGDFFGEVALLTQQPRSTSAVARRDSELLSIQRESFMAVLDTEPSLARQLLETTARRLSTSSERESALAFMDAQARLARILLQMDKKAAAKGYIEARQEELAQRTGLTRQTVAKILGQWRRAGWLITGRGRIMLLNRSALENMEESRQW
jgi:CRP-like cAMP-binding protein